jgi:demethylmenaquinone methyltransferase/2-methoxy-6-polyprenyl-1,4-benzoquinol methylase
MLQLGRVKSSRLAPVTADALELPFSAAQFDGVMVGWGVRNLTDLDAGLAEAARVMVPSARLVILEMALPSRRWLRSIYQFYFRRVLPRLGRLISKHRTAYTWLPESTQAFPGPAEFTRRLAAQGFDEVHYRPLMGGVCALYVAERSER